MNALAAKRISLRPEQAGDEDFLFKVYASTRQEELDLTGWNAHQRAAFLDMQFKAMRHGYRAMFPAAEFSIILREERNIGRMVIDRTEKEVRVVDLALLPESRNQGVGTLLMQHVCQGAEQVKKTVTLSVLKNTRSISWYQRLGFSIIGHKGLYEEMERAFNLV
ncbi:MAG TPA: GNAT family N-acetyltransferase [Verrucomicrobiae bacterium]|jgi:ribosomal protein S18 acetylase RimI-like enzyme